MATNSTWVKHEQVRDTFTTEEAPSPKNKALYDAFDEAKEWLSIAANRLDVGPLTLCSLFRFVRFDIVRALCLLTCVCLFVCF